MPEAENACAPLNRGHVREATGITSRNLAEARRFFHDLAPADIADGTLPQALGALAERESGPAAWTVSRPSGT